MLPSGRRSCPPPLSPAEGPAVYPPQAEDAGGVLPRAAATDWQGSAAADGGHCWGGGEGEGSGEGPGEGGEGVGQGLGEGEGEGEGAGEGGAARCAALWRSPRPLSPLPPRKADLSPDLSTLELDEPDRLAATTTPPPPRPPAYQDGAYQDGAYQDGALPVGGPATRQLPDPSPPYQAAGRSRVMYRPARQCSQASHTSSISRVMSDSDGGSRSDSDRSDHENSPPFLRRSLGR